MRLRWLVLLLSCTAPLLARDDGYREMERVVDELRLELADLKHALHTFQVEMQILDDKLKHQDRSVNALKTQTLGKQPKLEGVSQQMAALEKKIFLLENVQEKVAADLRQINGNFIKSQDRLEQIGRDVTVQASRLDEVAKLKTTLTSISKAINPAANTPLSGQAAKTYKVKAGDSLEKIARNHHISVDALKKFNRLETDRIQIGQTLKLDDE